MRIVAWDVPVRLFHGALAVLAVFSFTTGHVGGEWLAWHMRSGYCILALLAFRIAWGVVGSDTARFASFVRGPAAAWRYGRETFARRHPAIVGHNPLGGWMVLVLLAALALQAFSGLFVDDEIATQGPLAVKVSNAFVSRMSHWHQVNQWVVVGAVALHVLAIAAYWKLAGINLVRPMIDGGVEVAPGTPAPRLRSSLLAALLLAVAATGVYWLVAVYPKAP